MAEISQIETWIAEAKGGDRSALAKLLAQFHPQLRARAGLQLEGPVQARAGPDDVLQEVYVEVVRKIGSFEDRGPGSFLAWLQTILTNKIVDLRRAAHCQARDVKREVPAEVGSVSSSHWDLLGQLYAESGTASRVVRRQEALGALLDSLAGLSESHRQIIQLRFLEGCSVAEVAKRMAKSEAAVAALTRRALVVLRESMDRLGDFTRGE